MEKGKPKFSKLYQWENGLNERPCFDSHQSKGVFDLVIYFKVNQ